MGAPDRVPVDGRYLLLFRLSVPYTLVRRNPERSLLLLMPLFHPYARALAPLVSALRKRAASATRSIVFS